MALTKQQQYCILGCILILSPFMGSASASAAAAGLEKWNPDVSSEPRWAKAASKNSSSTSNGLRIPVISCGTTKHFRANEVAEIQSPTGGDSESRANGCRWRFLFTGCRLAISCPSFRLNSGPFCEDFLEIRTKSGGRKRYCGTRGPKGLELTGETEVTYRTNNVFGSLGFRCRLVCSEDGDSSEEPRPMAPPIKCSCGLTAPDTKIINGQETRVNEFPWMAGLVRKGGRTPFCGASLINSQYILTAAHCVAGRTPQNLEIIMNEHNTQVGTETAKPVVRRSVEAIYQHKSYNNRLDYDAAVIKLRESVEQEILDYTLLPVCLPSIGGPKRNYAGHGVTVSGWGVTSEGGSVSPVLRKTNVTVLTDIACVASYPGSITARMLCAAAPAKDACQGDSGGPLIHNDGGKYTQIGVVSWGHGCARPDKPGVYTRLTEFVSWIAQLTADGRYCDE